MSGGPYSFLKSQLGGGSYAYNYRTSSGSVAPLAIETLDQAEAIVFWLAGFPSPVNGSGTMVASRKTVGFNNDPTNP
ncbi:MAG TPA: hypothetical protein VG713_05825, partial [Pirellulales bacterium]|nr:hypothetical protein [Pirellulales bacterium]